jgi:hypothetical protein
MATRKKAWPIYFADYDKDITIQGPVDIKVDYDDVDHPKARKVAALVAATQVMQNALIEAEICIGAEIDGGAGKHAREAALAAVQDAIAISRRRIRA